MHRSSFVVFIFLDLVYIWCFISKNKELFWLLYSFDIFSKLLVTFRSFILLSPISPPRMKPCLQFWGDSSTFSNHTLVAASKIYNKQVAESNLRIINYLDVTVNPSNGFFRPYHKPDDIILITLLILLSTCQHLLKTAFKQFFP